MAETNRVVIHFADGKIAKGTTIDFNPTQQKFHVIPASSGPSLLVMTPTLKAIFFVKNLDNPSRNAVPRRGFEAPRSTNALGKKIAVVFKDGELICGYTLNYVAGREGFFMFPADPDTNNIRVYVIAAATSQVKTGPEAEALAQQILSRRSADRVKA